jgi:hypothetical protein
MNPLSIALALLLWPIPVAVQGIGAVTLMEGSLRVVRGTAVMQGAEGMRLRQGDILESSDKGFVQLEFTSGGVVALGPASRLYVFRQSANRSGGKAGSEVTTELILLSGWLKGESSANAGAYRYESPMLAATSGNGTVVVHAYDSGSDIFVESGWAAIGEVSPDGSSRQSSPAKAGQFFSRRSGRLTSASRPDATFLDAMPRPFRDTLPARLAQFASKSVEPKIDHPVTYAELQPWLKMPPAWRRGFVDRFEPRLKDPEFRKQLEAHVAEYPEWDAVLHPEKHHTETPPAPATSSESPLPKV